MADLDQETRCKECNIEEHWSSARQKLQWAIKKNNLNIKFYEIFFESLKSNYVSIPLNGDFNWAAIEE